MCSDLSVSSSVLSRRVAVDAAVLLVSRRN